MKAGKSAFRSAAVALLILCGCSGSASEPVGTQRLALAPSPLPSLPPGAPSTTLRAPASSNPMSPNLADPNVRAKLRTIASGIASAAGVSSPTMRAVGASDHQSAELALTGTILFDHAPVYVIKMAGGTFTAQRHPPQAPAPQGQFLTVIVDATTYRVTDIGYVNVEPDLRQIGPSATDL